ncbi:MAG: hypothetical protein KA761_00110 [Gemmatimonadaceae bacterium]|nr:hypothetical protein [Gemmatimonadaceae bacterium]
MEELSVGQRARVLYPFEQFGEQDITEVVLDESGAHVAYVLGEAGAFDWKYLEVVQ